MYDAFGQRQVSTIYSALNQYHVVMEVAPRYWQSPATLDDLFVSTYGGSPSDTSTTNAVPGSVVAQNSPGTVSSAATASTSTTSTGAPSSAENLATNSIANSGRGSTSSGAAVSTALESMVPLAAFTHYGPGATALAVNHQGLLVASTISFNIRPGKSLSDADTANALLDAQAQLATDYFDLRGAARSDVMTAEAQLQATRTQLIAVRQQRGQYEHAIAALTGQPPADLSIPTAPLTAHVPVVPTGLPSTLLERNPQVAAAERQMQQENALVGVAKAAFFPDLTLTGLFGYAGNPLSSLIKAGNRIWSGGASATQLLFDAGSHSAALNAAHAVYDQSVANYRQTVLTAFQQVEDELLALHVLQDESDSAAAAVKDAQQAADIALAEYQAGTVAYTSVVIAQQTLIADQQTALTIAQNRLVASVTLVEALGGGWNSAELKL